MVARQLSWKESSANLLRREDFPTELFPMMTTLNKKSYSLIIYIIKIFIYINGNHLQCTSGQNIRKNQERFYIQKKSKEKDIFRIILFLIFSFELNYYKFNCRLKMIIRTLSKLMHVRKNQLIRQFSKDNFKKEPQDEKGFFMKKKNNNNKNVDNPTEEKVENNNRENDYREKESFKFNKKGPIDSYKSKNQGFYKNKNGVQESEKKSQKFSLINQEQTGNKQSIFFVKDDFQKQQETKLQETIPQAPKINILKVQTGIENKFYDRLSQTDEQLRKYLNNKDFNKLNSLLTEYAFLSSPNEVEKEVYSLLITQNVTSYLLYLQSIKKQLKILPHKVLQKIYNALLYHEKYDQISSFLDNLRQGQLRIDFNSIQMIFNDIKINNKVITMAEISPLQDRIRVKMALVYKIFNNQLRYYQRLTKIKKEKGIKRKEIGNWFLLLAELALKKNICRNVFVKFYQNLVFKYQSIIYLQIFYKSEYFPLLLSKNYFGSHANLSKLSAIIDNIEKNDSLNHCLNILKETMILYKTKHHKNPFPVVTDIIKSRNTVQINNESCQKGLIYLTLAFYNGESDEVFSYLKEQKGKQLINMVENEGLGDIINDFYLGINKKLLKSQNNQSPPENNKEKPQKQAKKYKYIFYLLDQIKNEKNQHRLILLNKVLTYFTSKIDLEKTIDNLQPEEIKKIRQLLSKEVQKPQVDNIKKYQQEYDEYIENQLSDREIVEQQFLLQLSQEMRSPDEYINYPFENLDQEDKENFLKFKKGVQEDVNLLTLEMYDMEHIDVQIETKNPFQQFQEEQEEQDQDDYFDFALHEEDTSYIHAMDAVKACLKLQKPQLAYYIFQAEIMDQLIIERTRKNIKFALSQFLKESYKQQKQHIENLEQISQCIEKSIDMIDDELLKSIYNRLQNFDDLIYSYLPPDQIKHEFWQTTLMFNRAEDLLRIDANYKINDLKYEAQHRVLPEREKELYIANHKRNWRKKLIEELGIVEAIKGPYEEEADEIFKYESQFELAEEIHDEFYDMSQVISYKQEQGIPLNEWEESIAANLLLQNQEEGQGESAQVVDQTIQQMAEEVAEQKIQQLAEQVAEQVVIEVAKEQAQSVQEGEQILAQHQQDVVIAASQQTETIAKAEESSQSAQQQLNIKPIEVNEPSISIQDKMKILRKREKALKIKGYDFTSFLELARSDIKPIFEKRYEVEKQFKKHVICLESLVEEAMLFDNHSLQKKLLEFQENVKSIENIAIFNAYGLWNYDFESVEQPEEYLKLTNQFRMRYFQFKKYKGKKGFEEQTNFNNKLLIIDKTQMLVNLYAAHQVVIDILLKKNHHFKKAQAVVKIEPQREVEELMKWGLINDEPMAIYLAEKMAMVTNQTIAHPIAIRVSQYLSHKRNIPEERIQRCKESLKIVGRINREHIYDFSKDYQHITVRKHFNSYLQEQQVQLNSAALEFMLRVDPTHSHQQQNFNLMKNLRKGPLRI